MEFVVETNSLTKKYDSLIAVNKLDLKVAQGSIHGFLGPNGAGKTTTIKILVGLLKPDIGTVIVLGKGVRGKRFFKTQKSSKRPLKSPSQSGRLCGTCPPCTAKARKVHPVTAFQSGTTATLILIE